MISFSYFHQHSELLIGHLRGHIKNWQILNTLIKTERGPYQKSDSGDDKENWKWAKTLRHSLEFIITPRNFQKSSKLVDWSAALQISYGHFKRLTIKNERILHTFITKWMTPCANQIKKLPSFKGSPKRFLIVSPWPMGGPQSSAGAVYRYVYKCIYKYIEAYI